MLIRDWLIVLPAAGWLGWMIGVKGAGVSKNTTAYLLLSLYYKPRCQLVGLACHFQKHLPTCLLRKWSSILQSPRVYCLLLAWCLQIGLEAHESVRLGDPLHCCCFLQTCGTTVIFMSLSSRQDNCESVVSMLFFCLSVWHNLDSSQKQDPQLRKRLSSDWPEDKPVIDEGGASTLCDLLSLGKWLWMFIRKQTEQATRE